MDDEQPKRVEKVNSEPNPTKILDWYLSGIRARPLRSAICNLQSAQNGLGPGSAGPLARSGVGPGRLQGQAARPISTGLVLILVSCVCCRPGSPEPVVRIPYSPQPDAECRDNLLLLKRIIKSTS